MRMSDWSSDVCSSDLVGPPAGRDQYVCQQCAIIGYVALGPQAGEDRCCLRNVAGAVGGPGLRRAQERRRLDQLGGIAKDRCDVICTLVPQPELHDALGIMARLTIGRAPSRERVCQKVYLSVVPASLKKKKRKT